MIILGACGAPGSDAVFHRGNPKLDTDSIARAGGAVPAPALRDAPKMYGGLYRRRDGESRFQPCGTKVLLAVDGTWNGRNELRELLRWNSVWQGQNLYGVFTGWILHDTVRATGTGMPDSAAAGTPRTRFFLVDVDSLRSWNPDDCGGMKAAQ